MVEAEYFEVELDAHFDVLDWNALDKLFEREITDVVRDVTGREDVHAVIPMGGTELEYETHRYRGKRFYDLFYSALFEVYDRTGRNVIGEGGAYMRISCSDFDRESDRFVDCDLMYMEGEFRLRE